MDSIIEAITITALYKTDRFHNYRADGEGSRQAYLVLNYLPMVAGVKKWERVSDFYHLCDNCRVLA